MSSSTDRNVAPTHQWQSKGQALTLQVAGDWRGASGGSLSAAPALAKEGASGGEKGGDKGGDKGGEKGDEKSGTVTVDGHALTAWDAGLTAALREQLAPLSRLGLQMQLDGLPEDVRAVLTLALPAAGEAAPPIEATPPWLERVGQSVLAARADTVVTAAFFGEVVLALGRLLRGKSGMRYGDLLRQIDQTGPLSIPIVSLTCFLIGLMLAYMGGAQLDKLGAQAYIADIVTVGMVRELAGLMTGMILTGRVGAAFAAQLATMKAGEEIDALRALGVDPVDHLVMPRILALVMVAPLVMTYAALVGVLAGGIPATLVYAVPWSEYLHKSANALTWTHIWIGLFKGTLYAALLALAGCREGLHAGRNAQAVGEATTTAVVKGLVWIITAACTTTVVFQSLDL